MELDFGCLLILGILHELNCAHDATRKLDQTELCGAGTMEIKPFSMTEYKLTSNRVSFLHNIDDKCGTRGALIDKMQMRELESSSFSEVFVTLANKPNIALSYS